MKYISLSSGSCGNSHYVETGKTKILVDAGISGKKIIENLNEHEKNLKDLNAILVTHEHTDHIQSVGVISRKYDVPIYTTEKTWEEIKNHIGNIKEKNIIILDKNKKIAIGDIEIDSFQTVHDAVDSVGYTLNNGKKKISIVTDLGVVTQEVFEKIKGSDIAIIESNYDDEMLSFCSYSPSLKKRIRSEVGHLSNNEAAYLAIALVKTGTSKILLGHLSKESNLPQLAFQTVGTILTSHKMGPKDVSLDVLLRGRVSKMYSIR